MRILAIRGENLASLAEFFQIEFEQEPLRSTGLFAITGETGAGKSTILDALCLALYDDFPRVVAPGARDEMPDPSGAGIRENDPRTILRRGAGRGFAEADFVARDGNRYRARCDLMRARGKVAGKLQQRGRALWRIDENGEKIEALESGVESVNRRIVELTDLTFDQFRRTALLAQGDFDAFLRADARERADLLEKITGAEIYGLLSKRVFERWSEAKNALAALEERGADIGVMADDDRAAVLAESAQLAERRATFGAEHKETRASLARLDAATQAREKLAQAEAERAAAQEALAALAQERRTLAELARVEPLRAPRDELRRAEAALLEKEAAAKGAQAQAETARAALGAAQSQAQANGEALEAIAAEIAQFEPLWMQAAALDARIETQAREAAKAQGDEEAAKLRATEKSEALAKARAQEQATSAECDAARAAFDAVAGARDLSERWREIDDWLSKRAAFSREKADSARLLQTALAELKRADDSRAAFDAADEADREALEALGRQTGEREAALHALDAPAAQLRLDAVGRSHDALQAMARCARDHDAAQASAGAASADIARLEGKGASLARRLEALRSARDAQAAQSRNAERLGELADAATDPHVLDLRATLQDGKPCPVCGGEDHPFAHSNDAARKLVEALRGDREAARSALAQTDRDILAVSASRAGAQAMQAEATRRREDALAAIGDAAREYAGLVAQAQHPESPTDIAGAGERIAALIEGMAAQREGLVKIRMAAQALETDIANLRKAADRRRGAIDSRASARREAEAAARRAGEDRAALEQKLSGAQGRIESLDRSLSPFLTLCDLTADDLARNPIGARKRLEAAGARFLKAREAFEGAGERLEKLAPQIATLDAEARALADQTKAAAADHAARAGELARSQSARADLLGGEATAAHRRRFDEKHKSLRAAHEQARAARDEAAKTAAACDERNAGRARDVEAGRVAVATARASFSAALAAAGRDEENAAPLLAMSKEEAEALRGRVQGAQSAIDAAQAALAQRRRDLAEAEAAGLPEFPRETLAAREDELAQALEDLADRLGGLREKLAQDDAARGRAQALSAEIEAARATRKLWDEINAAIGSKEGDKFRRFAQSVTLEQLVALANRRLSLLSPRYRLERAGEMGSLGLQIVDRDLGDERRSTRSLSGGERFLASLALALALAGLEGRDSFVDTLFIDEGFGALDSSTLDVAIDALETLQGQGRKVGVISHVESLQNRIAAKISVERRGGGVSRVRLIAPGFEPRT